MVQEMIKEGNIFEVNNLYETTFPKLTEQFFKVITTKHYFTPHPDPNVQSFWILVVPLKLGPVKIEENKFKLGEYT
jgi:hypothetical protein